MSEETNPLADLAVDTENLYREETFSDLKVASIRRLTPVTTEGLDDPSRPTMFIGETTLMSARGPLPINCPIEATTLQEAFDAFPEAVQAAFAHLGVETVRRYALPNLHALNFVIEGALQGGVNASLGLDRHGKTLSFLLLGEVMVDVPESCLPEGSPYLNRVLT